MQETLMREYKANLEKDRAERLGYRHSSSLDGESRDRKKRRKDRRRTRERKSSEGKDKVMFYCIDRCTRCGYNKLTPVHSQGMSRDTCG